MAAVRRLLAVAVLCAAFFSAASFTDPPDGEPSPSVPLVIGRCAPWVPSALRARCVSTVDAIPSKRVGVVWHWLVA
jgi:hypothetical protein